MPQRFLRPGITTSSPWNKVSFQAQSLFVRLLTMVDDFGRFDGRASVIHGSAFAVWNEENPKKAITPQETAALCAQLAAEGLVKLYEAGGKRVIQVVQWQERCRSEKSKWPEQLDINGITINPVPPQDSAADCAQTDSIPQDSAASLAIATTPSPLHHRPSPTAAAELVPAGAAEVGDPNSGTPPDSPPALPTELATEAFRAKWDEYVAYRRTSKIKPLQPASVIAQWRALATFGLAVAMEAIDRTIANGWQGLFPERIATARGRPAGPDKTKTYAMKPEEMPIPWRPGDPE